jgi:membrane protein required for colicin V production
MAWIDWAIVIVLALSVLGGLRQGFFRAVFSLGGLLLGLLLAAWNYGRVAALLVPIVRLEPVADCIGFLLIAIVVMALAGAVGSILAKTLHHLGLGCLDRLGGAALGFFQGVLLVTLCVWVAIAFRPHAEWLTEGRLPRKFFGACHLSTHLSPNELSQRVREGLSTLERETPVWMHPEGGKS